MNPTEILDDLLREMDLIQSHPIRHIARVVRIPARSTIDAWVQQFVNLLVVRP